MNDQTLEKGPPTFAEFLKLWKSDSNEATLKDYSHYIHSNPIIENVLSLGPCFVYMLNYSTMKYLYLSPGFKNILGYEFQEFPNIGPEYFLPIMHQDDLNDLMNKIFPQILETYYATPIENRKKLRSTYDYRLRRSDGKYIRLMQQTIVVETDSEGKPLIDIGIVSDISQYKKGNNIKLSISMYDQTAGFWSTETTSVNKEKINRISERELEILKLLIKGNSSKKIADQLHISVNTVRNHRQNLMEKTETKNIAELITFAHSNSLI